ncbi:MULTISPECIES: hypothetical protein [Stenotrophomonas]|uniref:hypothetical protein n=1 Tax=Stenotrophomonas TaxID=40323 RepID=UPI0007703F25|nr:MULTISPECIES: hypothetical protein [Stenotrophomonas]AMJ55895.1 hypothetical protein AXG53_03985 [Stenotrophomonas sp. KCTC 12332]
MKLVAVLAAFAVLAIPLNLAFAAESTGTGPIHVGITDAGSTLGLAFTPPGEEGWTRNGSGASTTLSWNAESASDNRKIEAYLTRLDAPIAPISGYIKTVKRNLEQGYASSPRFKISSLQVSQYPSDPRCARIHLLLEARQPAADGQRQWSEQYALSCGSLKTRGVGYELRYYHRYTDAHRDDGLEAKANAVLESLVIEGG